MYFSQPTKDKDKPQLEAPLDTVESMTNFYATHMDNNLLNSKRSITSNKQSDFRETAKFGPGYLAALASPKSDQLFNVAMSNYNSGAGTSNKLVTPKFNFGMSHHFFSNQDNENVISPTNGD